MHDFDMERAHRPVKQFKLCGEVFDLQPGIQPEVYAAWRDSETDSFVKVVETTDTLILAFLVPEHRDKWKRLRQVSDGPDVISEGDMRDIIVFLVANETERPTPAPPSSTTGESSGAVSSADGSPSPEVAPVA